MSWLCQRGRWIFKTEAPRPDTECSQGQTKFNCLSRPSHARGFEKFQGRITVKLDLVPSKPCLIFASLANLQIFVQIGEALIRQSPKPREPFYRKITLRSQVLSRHTSDIKYLPCTALTANRVPLIRPRMSKSHKIQTWKTWNLVSKRLTARVFPDRMEIHGYNFIKSLKLKTLNNAALIHFTNKTDSIWRPVKWWHPQ